MKLAVDIGTSYTSACIVNPKGEAQSVEVATGVSEFGGKYSMPTAVLLGEDSELLIGQSAVNSRRRRPACYKDNFKRYLGQSVPVMLGEQSFQVEELYTQILLHIRECVKKLSPEAIDELCLTYPATYENNRKELLKKAAADAGFSNVRLLDEPSAAAMCYLKDGFIREGEMLLVYDFGGGTFDVSVIRYIDGKFAVEKTGGLSDCGGSDMDRTIIKDIVECLRKEDGFKSYTEKEERKLRLQAQIEKTAVKAKHQLTSEKEFKEWFELGMDDCEYRITREQFDGLVADLIQQAITECRHVLQEAGHGIKKLSKILMVGGTSRIPLVREMVTKMAGEVPVLYAPDLELAVAQGALYHLTEEIVTETISDTEERVLEKPSPVAEITKSTLSMARALLDDGEETEAFKMYQIINTQDDNAEAQYEMATLYATGRGTEKDFLQASFWFHRAELNGNERAKIFRTKTMLEYMEEFETDSPKLLLDKMLEYNSYLYPKEDTMKLTIDRLFDIGGNHFNKQRYDRAAKYFRAAAEYGNDGMSQNYLGMLYNQGVGVGKNDLAALYWWDRAVENHIEVARQDRDGLFQAYKNGNSLEQFADILMTLADWCMKGEEGVPRDVDKAQYWRKKLEEEIQKEKAERQKPVSSGELNEDEVVTEWMQYYEEGNENHLSQEQTQKAEKRTLSKEDAIRELCRVFIERHSQRSGYFTVKPTNRFLRKYEILGQEIFLAHDDSLVGSGGSGFVITNCGIYCKPSFSFGIVKFTSFQAFSKAKIRIGVVDKGDMQLYADDVEIAVMTGIRQDFPWYFEDLEQLFKNIANIVAG